MDTYVTGGAIRALREKRGLTQLQLAERLCVSDKAVSKWETGRGLPDVSLLEPLAGALGVSVAELLAGRWVTNNNRSGNMSRSCFYVCPVCGNILHAMGSAAVSCCGVSLPPLEAEEPDGEHPVSVSRVDGEYLVTVSHPMEKDHYISMLALVGADRTQLVKLYPEQEAQTRFSISGGMKLYALCNRHGLFSMSLKGL